MDTMICLVSKQTMPNVIPVLMYKPKNVLLLWTKGFEGSLHNLSHLFLGKRISVRDICLDNEYDIEGIQKKLNEVFGTLNGNVSVNITGGTKLMALAAYKFAEEKNLRILYCDTDNKVIRTLSSNNSTEPITCSLSVKDYLLAYGYDIVSSSSMDLYENYSELFSVVEQYNLWHQFLNFARQCRQRDDEGNNRLRIGDKLTQDNIFLLEYKSGKKERINDYYNLTITINNRKIMQFKDVNKTLTKGTWLEIFMGRQIYTKYKVFPLIGCNIKSGNGAPNELDVLVVYNYKLFIFSCKSGILTETRGANQALYQVETLKTLAGGTYGDAHLVLTDPRITNRNIDIIKQRAKDMRVKVHFGIEEIKNIQL